MHCLRHRKVGNEPHQLAALEFVPYYRLARLIAPRQMKLRHGLWDDNTTARDGGSHSHKLKSLLGGEEK